VKPSGRGPCPEAQWDIAAILTSSARDPGKSRTVRRPRQLLGATLALHVQLIEASARRHEPAITWWREAMLRRSVRARPINSSLDGAGQTA